MTTKALLEEAILVAGKSVPERMGELALFIDQVEMISENLRSAQEKELVKVAEAFRQSKPVVDISVAINAGGVHEGGMPRLAIASFNASQQRLTLESYVRSDGSVIYECDNEYPRNRFEFPEGTVPLVGNVVQRAWRYTLSGSTVIPIVPPLLRPENTDGLAVLFEVAEWKPIPRAVDPYLVRKIAGNIYVIEATWDLTAREVAAYQAARKIGI